MRSEIACVRCAVSKTKCVNTGIDTTCRTCADRGLTCTYRPPKWSAGRAHQSNNLSQEEENDLDWSLLTPAVWNELGDIFTKHYSADLGFFSVPAFLNAVSSLREADDSSSPSTTSTPTRVSTDQRKPRPELLLAFLALTGRFHPKLIRYHSMRHGKRQDRPYMAAEFYAAAAGRKFESALRLRVRDFDLQDVHVRLMLVVQAWTMHRGATAWALLGEAIRIAQVLGLHHMDQQAPVPGTAVLFEADLMGADLSKTPPHPEGWEERRRTFSCCHALDCQLSLGKYRPRMLQAREDYVQRYVHQRAFARPLDLDMEDAYGNGMNGVRLPSISACDNDTSEYPATDDLYHRYESGLELLHLVTEQRCHGTCNTDTVPPWDSQSRWYQVLRQILDFQSTLPDHLKLTAANLASHRDSGLSSTFVHLHAVIFVCLGAVHADWLPFLPVRCTGPDGPLEGPLYPDLVKGAPQAFWASSARHYFNSMSEILCLLQTQIESDVLPETPLIGWIAFRAVLSALYAHHFPQMDTDRRMSALCGTHLMLAKSEAEDALLSWPPSQGPVAAGLYVIRRVQEHSPVARQWSQTLQKLHEYTGGFREDFERHATSSLSMVARDGEALRHGGPGGGADEFEFILGRVRWFGELVDRDLIREDRP